MSLLLKFQAVRSAVQKASSAASAQIRFKTPSLKENPLMDFNIGATMVEPWIAKQANKAVNFSNAQMAKLPFDVRAAKQDILASLALMAPGTTVGAIFIPFGKTYDSCQEHFFEMVFWDSMDRQFF